VKNKKSIAVGKPRVEVREELGFRVYLKLSIYASEVASAKHANQCKACKLLIYYVRRPEPRTFNTSSPVIKTLDLINLLIFTWPVWLLER
jgi:hypothetical protein